MTPSVMDYLNSTGIRVGSRKFDLHSPDSDYDYVLDNCTKQYVEDFLRRKKIQYVNEETHSANQIEKINIDVAPMLNTSVIKFEHNGKNYHLLFYATGYYNCFVEINYLMKRMVSYRKEPFMKKSIRVSTYNRLMMAVFASRGLYVPSLV